LFSKPSATAPLAASLSSQFADFRLTPRYPASSPLDSLYNNVEAGHDEFITEKYAEEIEDELLGWGRSLRRKPPDVTAIAELVSPSFSAAPFRAVKSTPLRSTGTLQVFRNQFSDALSLGRDSFLHEVLESFGHLCQFLVTEFEVTSIRVTGTSPLTVQSLVRYDLLASGPTIYREGRVGYWEIEWETNPVPKFRARKWRAVEETLSRSTSRIFEDITTSVLSGNSSYQKQMLHGVDYWRTILDAASGIDIYGNNGLAVGDIDNDGFDDFYVCQPAGIPNRLYHNRGDGTFEDVTHSAGVGVLDGTACALFADFSNRGVQDLVVVRTNGPLLFRNQGSGKFRLQPDAFKYAHAPEGTFTSAAAADFDRDGFLDLYFCLYSYYQGLDKYRVPVPYYDAENGPPNFLFRNNGDGSFRDVTAATGMNQNNHRFSLGCAWGDFNNDGWPDLYVANDFGKKNLYRNNGDGTFTDIAEEAGVVNVGPGMSACWFDYDNDGKQDLYVANMWEAPGLRVTMQDHFMQDAPAEIRAYFRNHAMGNALFHNAGDGRFMDQSSSAGVDDGRWSWSSTSFDFDHDGYLDLYVPNGFISQPGLKDIESFFWRQVVPKSPLKAQMTQEYEMGWNAANELIRSDQTWSGYQRNIVYLNNHDGTFSDVSGAVGLDFREDSRAFALADFDHDGRLEIVLKNRNAPQLRVLHNEMPDLGSSVSFRLRGYKSNRDAIGAAVVIEGSEGTQTRFVQAGLGFSTQHTKELFFGLGKHSGPLRATVRWPSGVVQTFGNLPANHRISIEEGSDSFIAQPFRAPALHSESTSVSQEAETLPPSSANWLLNPLVAPDFTLPDLVGTMHRLGDFKDDRILLNFWATWALPCHEELASFETYHSQWARKGLRLITINVNRRDEAKTVRGFIGEKHLSFLVLLADDRWAATYNVIYRYLYDRRRDLGIPTSFLIDDQGLIVRVYQGPVEAQNVIRDADSIPRTTEERIKKGLPFPGDYYGDGFPRNLFSYGVAFLERGLREEAITFLEYGLEDSFDAEAYYNLGTLYLQKGMQEKARTNLLHAIEIRPDYPDCLNNLGLLAAHEGQSEEAARYFQEAIRRRPDYMLAVLNLVKLYRRGGRLDEAREVLERALQVKADDPDLYNSLGTVFAQANDLPKATEYLRKALSIRPQFPEAMDNLGMLYTMSGKTQEAVSQFQECIRVAPEFDQPYLNLASLYLRMDQKVKAQDILRALLQHHPDHPQAKKELEAISY
jgi:tetratricopeptide (TPR) repeat protein